METTSKHKSENLKDFSSIHKAKNGRYSAERTAHRPSDEQAAHLHAVIAQSISDSQLEIGRWILDNVFDGDVRAALSGRSQHTGISSSQKSGGRPRRDRLMARRSMRGRRR